jgi:serine/threonine protein kinase
MTNSANRPVSAQMKRLSADMERLGKILTGRYELMDLLGYGGMGAVFKARHLLMDRFVAVKFLLPDVAEDPAMRDRFLREATASAKINHPNVVQIIDYGEGPNGEAYIVNEFLDGVGLDQVLKQERQIEVNRAVHIFQQICQGVGKAHAKGIIHRDLKPSNVMLVEELGEKDFVKIVDFGLAKALDPSEESQRLTQTGEVFGSPVYMSPEQCMGQQLGPAADIYAMGVLMYESLMGKPPFLGAVMAETIARQLRDAPKPFAEMRPDLNIPAPLEAVVMKALSKDPEERQLSMQEMKDELDEATLPRIQARPRRAAGVLQTQHLPAANQSSTQTVRSAVEKPSDGTVRMSAQTPTQTVKMQARTGRLSSEAPAEDSYAAVPSSVIPRHILLFSVAGLVVLFSAGIFIGMSMNHPSNSNGSVTPAKPAVNVQAQQKAQQEQIHTSAAPQTKLDPPATANVIVPAEKKIAHQQHLPMHKKHEVVVVAHEDVKPHKTAAHHVQASTNTSDEEPYHKHHRDWHDFSYGYERKESYTHNWSVPLSGSKSSPDQYKY